jgi:phosphoribosyl 1,2-cyclic phosphodiesterase
MASASDGFRRLTFRGVRGTVPTPERGKELYGGNTTCIEVALSQRRIMLIDCGSGLRTSPTRDDAAGTHFEVLLTHYHVDHLMGLPLFEPLYEPHNSFTFYGHTWSGGGVREALERFFGPPLFPISLGQTSAAKEFVDLDERPLELEGLRITHARLNHPQGVTAFRLHGEGRSVVFATDCERGEPSSDALFEQFARDAGVLIHDAQYTAEEYDGRYRGWGHSTWEQALEAAAAARAERLLLFHHAPERGDEELDAIVKVAKRLHPDVEAAREGMSLEF